MSACDNCTLRNTSINGRLKGRGCSNPKIFIIGDAPTPEDDKQGRVFSTIWDNSHEDYPNKIIQYALGLHQDDDIYYTNVVKCCPYIDPIYKGTSRPPSPAEITSCRSYLLTEIELIAGKDTIIMPLGNSALSALFPVNEGITREVGKQRELLVNGNPYIVVPNYHPAAVIRQRSLQQQFNRVMSNALSGELKEYKEDIPYKILNPVEAIDKAYEIINLFRSGEIDSIVFDTETNSLNPVTGKVVMMSVAHDADETAYAIPLVVCNDLPETHLIFNQYPDIKPVTDQERIKIIDAWRQVLELVPITGHNLKFDIKFVHTNGIADLNKITIKDDTYLLYFITYGRLFGNSLGLKAICKKMFNINVDWDVEIDQYLKLFKRVDDRLFSNIKTSLLGKYASYDAYFNKLLINDLKQKRIFGQESIYNLLLKATKVFADIELSGCSIDMDLLKSLEQSYNTLRDDITEKIFALPKIAKYKVEVMAEEELNNSTRRVKWNQDRIMMSRLSLGSPILKSLILYSPEFYNLPVLVKTPKNAPSSGADALKRLIETSSTKNYDPEGIEFCILLQKLISIETIISKYITKIPLEVIDGMYYTDFNLAGTVTGRLSSGFHTIPSISDVKKIFNSRWAKEGGLICPADYSQLELRVMAGESNETTWITSYKADIDLHLNTAAEVVFKKPHDKITKAERKVGKVLNFGVVYGRSPWSVASDLGITVVQAEEYLNTFFSKLTTLTAWMNEKKSFAEDNGFVVTPFGRIIPIPEVYSKDPKIYEHGMRAAVNYSVQSPASDLGLSALVKMWEMFKEQKLRSVIIGMVHDSIIVDIHPAELKTVVKIMKWCGEDYVTDLSKDWMNDCPIVLDMSLGYSWGYSIEGKVGFENNNLVFEGEDMEKSWKILNMILKKNYSITEQIHEEKVLPDDYFSLDVIVKSKCKVHSKITIE